MAEVILLRHADKDRQTGQLTEVGKRRARELGDKLGSFDFVITSDKNDRLLMSAQLLVPGITPDIDQRAGVIYESEEQHKEIGELAKIHRFTCWGYLWQSKVCKPRSIY